MEDIPINNHDANMLEDEDSELLSSFFHTTDKLGTVSYIARDGYKHIGKIAIDGISIYVQNDEKLGTAHYISVTQWVKAIDEFLPLCVFPLYRVESNTSVDVDKNNETDSVVTTIESGATGVDAIKTISEGTEKLYEDTECPIFPVISIRFDKDFGSFEPVYDADNGDFDW